MLLQLGYTMGWRSPQVKDTWPAYAMIWDSLDSTNVIPFLCHFMPTNSIGVDLSRVRIVIELLDFNWKRYAHTFTFCFELNRLLIDLINVLSNYNDYMMLRRVCCS